jgi:hypothetical protein
VLQNFTHDSYIEVYKEDDDFKVVFQQLHGNINIEEGDDKAK